MIKMPHLSLHHSLGREDAPPERAEHRHLQSHQPGVSEEQITSFSNCQEEKETRLKETATFLERNVYDKNGCLLYFVHSHLVWGGQLHHS